MTKTEIENPAIKVSPEAVEMIMNLMAERGLKDQYLRIFVDTLGCSGADYGMAFSEAPREGDTEIESNGIRILMDSMSLLCLNGSTINFIDAPEGPDFRIDNPNEVSGADCSSCSHFCGQE